jgi:hypothetical protein
MKIAKLLMASLTGMIITSHLTASAAPRAREKSSLGIASTNDPGGWSTNSPACTNGAPKISTNAAAALAVQAAVLYAAVGPYDTNNDGQLDANEEAALDTALTQGEVALFGTNYPCIFRTQEVTNVTAWVAALYAVLATFDTNHNGTLDSTEQAALAAALDADTVSLPLFAPLHLGHQGHASAEGVKQRPIAFTQPGVTILEASTGGPAARHIIT